MGVLDGLVGDFGMIGEISPIKWPKNASFCPEVRAQRVRLVGNSGLEKKGKTQHPQLVKKSKKNMCIIFLTFHYC